MKLIGLIGATAPKFFLKEFASIIHEHGYAWYGWTIPVRKETLPILQRQLSEVGYFNLYGYSSSWPERGCAKASHKVEVKFVIRKEPVPSHLGPIVSHWITGKEANECPDPRKGIQDDGGYYTSAWEGGHGRYGEVSLPRRTWFAVADAREINLELSPKIFTPWNPRHKIHPGALRGNFIDIEDTIYLIPNVRRVGMAKGEIAIHCD